VRYLEHMTGGARPDERVPMIVALHPMGGDPADLLQLLRRYRRRARVILPYGHPRRAGYTAELREYAGVEHDTSAEEEGEILEQIGRAAEGLAAAAAP
jgi:phospholipase/carboxylesterase